MASGLTSACTLLVLVTTCTLLTDVIYAGQTCAACTGTEGGADCHHYTTCNNNEVCHLTVYTNQQGQMLHDYGCSNPQACHHSVGSILVGRRTDTVIHQMCNVCCNDTNLCNQRLICDTSGTSSSNLPRECSELNLPTKTNGTYTIYPYGSKQIPVSVYCLFDSAGLGWTVIQRRYNGSVDFYRNWQAYKEGFGSPYGEYWLGNDVIHQLTSNNNHDLRIVMTDFDSVTKFAEYSIFHVGDESSAYKLLVFNYTGNAGNDVIHQLTAHGNHHLRVVMSDFEGVTKYAQYAAFTVGDESSNYQLLVLNYAGTAGDSLTRQNGHMFSTFDRDNDVYNDNCAQRFKGAWWYSDCHDSNLNGQYLSGHHDTFADGINWRAWRGYDYSLKTATMMILKY